MCKVNLVLSVRTMTSIASEQELWRQPYIWRLPAYNAIASAQKKLDSGPALDIIIFTEIFNATPPRQDPQKPSASPAWGSQPTLAGCTARVVSEQQFLRPGGPGPGQVRDAPSSRNRPAVHQRVGGSLRILPAFVLSGPVSVSARWPGGVTSRKARSAQRPQADCRGHGVRPPNPSSRCFAVPCAARTGRQRTVWPLGSSAQHRPATAPPKKTAVIVSTASSVSDALAAAYEELRREFLGSAHGPARGLGMALLLDGGMRAFRQHGRPYRTTTGPATNAPCQLADRDRCVAGRDGA